MTEKYKSRSEEFVSIHKQVFINALITMAVDENNEGSVRVTAHKLRRSIGRHYLGNRDDSLVDLAAADDEKLLSLYGIGKGSIGIINEALGMVLEGIGSEGEGV